MVALLTAAATVVGAIGWLKEKNTPLAGSASSVVFWWSSISWQVWTIIALSTLVICVAFVAGWLVIGAEDRAQKEIGAMRASLPELAQKMSSDILASLKFTFGPAAEPFGVESWSNKIPALGQALAERDALLAERDEARAELDRLLAGRALAEEARHLRELLNAALSEFVSLNSSDGFRWHGQLGLWIVKFSGLVDILNAESARLEMLRGFGAVLKATPEEHLRMEMSWAKKISEITPDQINHGRLELGVTWSNWAPRGSSVSAAELGEQVRQKMRAALQTPTIEGRVELFRKGALRIEDATMDYGTAFAVVSGDLASGSSRDAMEYLLKCDHVGADPENGPGGVELSGMYDFISQCLLWGFMKESNDSTDPRRNLLITEDGKTAAFLLRQPNK